LIILFRVLHLSSVLVVSFAAQDPHPVMKRGVRLYRKAVKAGEGLQFKKVVLAEGAQVE
jgi:hypothetical protein